MPVPHQNPLATDADGFGAFANVPSGAILAETIVGCPDNQGAPATPRAPHYRFTSIGAATPASAPQPCTEDVTETVAARSAFRIRPGAVTAIELRPPTL